MPFGTIFPATTAAPGTAQLSTGAEAVTGTDAAKAVTPSTLTSRLAAPGPIGGTTPGTGAFTSLTASVLAELNTPVWPLTVRGSVENNNAGFATGDFVLGTTGTVTTLGFGASSGNTYCTIQPTSTGGTVMANLVLNPSGGNVGIGTTADPLSKLSINGGLHVGGDSDAGDNNLLVDGSLTANSLNLGGATVLDILTATAALDFGSILAASYADLTITVTGAAVNDTVDIGLPAAVLGGAIFNWWVSAADAVNIRCNNAGAITIDPDSATYRATVIRI